MTAPLDPVGMDEDHTGDPAPLPREPRAWPQRDRRRGFCRTATQRLTFLAYGTDDVQIHSRQNGTITKGRMRFGKQWVDGKRADPPMLDIDTEQTPLDRHKRGTFIRLRFSSDTKPHSLSHLGSRVALWESILRKRTAAGRILIGQEPVAKFKVHLTLVGKDGLAAQKDIAPEFYYPHLVKRNPPLRFLDIGKYHEDNPT